MSKISIVVNKLETAYRELQSSVVSKMEKKLNQLIKYEQQNIYGHTDDENDVIFTLKLYEMMKDKDEKFLNEVRLKIQNLFVCIYQRLKEKEEIIFTQFRQIQQEIYSKYTKIIEKMRKNEEQIAVQKEYLNQHINFYHHKIKDQTKYDSVFEIKESLHKIGKNVKKNDIKIRKLMTEKQTILSKIELEINEQIKEEMLKNIEPLINFREYKQKKTAKHSSSRKMNKMKKSKSHNMMPSTAHVQRQQHKRASADDQKRFDLLNMSPESIKNIQWVNSNQSVVEIELLNSDLTEFDIFYLYHSNEDDEKDELAINDTIQSVHGEADDDDDDDHEKGSSDSPLPPPVTPFLPTETTTGSQWHKCNDITRKSSQCLWIKLPRTTTTQMNIDCVWIKLMNSAMKPSEKLLVESGQTVALQSSVEYNFDEVIIEQNGILTVNAASRGYLLLRIRDKLEIHSHGKINVSGLGHCGGKKYANGDGKGGGSGCAKFACGGGGSYGSFGENGRGLNSNVYRQNVDGVCGKVYGDPALNTISFGSGGGGGGGFGGNAGGIVCISCKNEIILHRNSGIYANGSKGKQINDGCGSGGSIFIKCKYLQNEDNSICFIQAIGGKHVIEEENAGHGGNGGFGRIRIYAQNVKNVQQLKKQFFVVQPVPHLG